MILYVTFGGMLATTWVQIIKACLLLFGATFMALAVLWHFGFNPEAMFAEAVEVHPNGQAIMAPGGLVTDPISAISLGLALMFGTAGLPHILMRFFTVPDAKQARRSVLYATGFIGYFYILTFIIGFGAITLLMTEPAFFQAGPDGAIDKIKGLIGGTNMAAMHLADAVGGNLFLGFISAVAFATILAVVAGLTLAGASAVSHDLYASVFARGRATEMQEVRVSRIATIVLGIVAIALGILFEQQNIAFMVGLAFAVAASCNFPILFLSMFWKPADHARRADRRLPRAARRGRAGDPLAHGVGRGARLRDGGLPVQGPGAVLDDRRLRSASGSSRSPTAAGSRARRRRRSRPSTCAPRPASASPPRRRTDRSGAMIATPRDRTVPGC